ncbi:MAG TPA: AAA family ATPase [Polyangia bacterium]|nr:AAA family ATPase [Polyangia bacterium]
MALDNGMLVAERFEIEREVRRGSADVVYRARDRWRDQQVMMRMLWADPHALEAESFLLGARMLAALEHPGLEVHVAHGRTPEGLLYLVTEWIEGEALEDRLRHRPLRVGESLGLARSAAAALGLVHERGFAHGSLWSGNLLLRGGQPGDVLLTGFGVAGRNPAWTTATDSGRIVEALRYVAPEQARGQARQSPSADVFALGCVLFECLTGAPPFGGRHAATVLGQILFQEAPPLRQLRPELPESLAQLVGRMLSKRPEERPAHGRAVVQALDAIVLGPSQLALVPGALPLLLNEGERQLVCLVLARPTAQARGAGVASVSNAWPAEFEKMMASLSMHIDQLADGSLIAVMRQAGHTAMDLAAQAARAALLLGARLPGWELALATGRGTGSGEPLVAEALRRAFELLEASGSPGAKAETEPGTGAGTGPEIGTARGDLGAPEERPADPDDDRGDPSQPESTEGRSPGPWLDELMARLLDPRFHVRWSEGGRALLMGERHGRYELRPLLGTVTPCLGRERELALLKTWVEYSLDEPMAQALLVLGPSGMGKSRLRQEFVRRLEENGLNLAIWLGRGDPMRAGTAYGLLAHAVRELCGIRGPGDVAEQRARLSERVGRNQPPAQRPLVAEFLGELCGLPFPDEESARLRAARQDPRLMSDQVTAAFVAFLGAECARQPVMLVLEDLHWSDAATVRLVEAALRDLCDQPLVVLALARPELKEAFPRLWTGQRMQELRLQALGKKASLELVERVLGERVTPEMAERIVTQAGGNALFLEELIRAVAEGRASSDEGGRPAPLPETVLAMLQMRFTRLEPMARRLLRAASLFGESFWCGGLYALLGGERHEQEIERAIETLLSGEVLVFRGENRAKGERLFAFRHSLLRDAAYGLMADEDRRLGHRLVAAYLEQSGERDPMVLAEHYRLGGRPERAAVHLTRAAHQALATSDLQGALARVARAVECGARGELLGTLRSIEAWAQLWQGNFEPAYRALQEALTLLPAGSAGWVSAQGAAVAALGFEGQLGLWPHIELLAQTALLPGAENAYMEPAMMAATFCAITGKEKTAACLLERMREVCGQIGRHEPRARAMLDMSALWYELLAEGDVEAYKAHAQAASEAFAETGDRRWLYAAQTHRGVGLLLLGEIEPGRALCREMLELLRQSDEPVARLGTQAMFAFALAEAGGAEHRAEARALAEEAEGDPLMPSFWAGMVHVALAIVYGDVGERGAAERAAGRALEVFTRAPAASPLAYALLGRILLAGGRLSEAGAAIEKGLEQLHAQGGMGLCDTKLHLAAAEVRRALGQEEAAARALRDARRTLDRHAARIADAESRERFLSHSREHARLQALGALDSLD